MLSLGTCLIGKTKNDIKQELTDVVIFILSFYAWKVISTYSYCRIETMQWVFLFDFHQSCDYSQKVSALKCYKIYGTYFFALKRRAGEEFYRVNVD